MKKFIGIVLIVATSILVIGVVTCLAGSSSSQSVSQLIDTLSKSPKEDTRAKAAAYLGKKGDVSAKNILLQTALNDPSSEVRIRAIEALGAIYGPITAKLNIERDKGLRSKKSVDEEILRLKGDFFAPLKSLLRPSCSIATAYPNDVRQFAAHRLSNLKSDPEVVPLALEALKANCALLFEERVNRENIRWRGRGDGLTGALVGLISSPNVVEKKSSSGRVYQYDLNRDMVPMLKEEIMHAEGDYRYSLVIVLRNIGRRLEYSKEAKGYEPIYQFENELLPLCVEGLQKSKSKLIRTELAWTLKDMKYSSPTRDVAKAIEELTRKRDINTKY